MPNATSVAARTIRLALPAFRDEGLLGGFKTWRRASRLAWIAAWNAGEMGPWYDWFERPENRGFLAAGPRIPLKPLRACIAAGWSVGRRIRAMRDTYDLMRSRGGPLMRMLEERHGAPLFAFEVGDSGPLELAVAFNYPHYKEGEINLMLRRPGGEYIADANCSFVRRDGGGHTCHVGCVQGGKGNHEDTKRIEKAMHGLRPTSFIVFAAQEFACALGAVEILGAGSKVQVHREKQLVHIPGIHRLTFDYDALWREADGEEVQEGEQAGWFRLPPHLARRKPEDMKPNKRSMYKKRYAMLDELTRKIAESL